jgi:Mitochondrial carrier protein
MMIHNWKYHVVLMTTTVLLVPWLLLSLSSSSLLFVSSSTIQPPISLYGSYIERCTNNNNRLVESKTSQLHRGRRRKRTKRQQESTLPVPFGLEFLTNEKSNDFDTNVVNMDNDNDDDDITNVQQCSIVTALGAAAAAAASGASGIVVKKSILSTLLRGSLLRIASDMTGGTPLESIKTRVTITKESAFDATRHIYTNYGIQGFYTGSISRTIEGALIGAVFMLGSVVTKRQLILIGCSPTLSALAGGLVGGVAQSIVMTPAGMIFTALSSNRNTNDTNNNNKKSKNSNSSIIKKNENGISICQRVIKEKGIGGLYIGIGPMCLRQATNWASRSGFTEIARTTLQLSQYGLYGELLSGIIGGVGSCWNTPIETIRVFSQRDVCIGVQPKSMKQYWSMIIDESGYQGLFRGITPRAIQAVWQTTFLVVVPNIIGV